MDRLQKAVIKTYDRAFAHAPGNETHITPVAEIARQVVEQYSGDSSAGKSTAIANYLTDFQGFERSVLLMELLLVELNLQMERGEPPEITSFRNRFPEMPDWVEQALSEAIAQAEVAAVEGQSTCTFAGVDSSENRPLDLGPEFQATRLFDASQDQQQPTFLPSIEDYEILTELGRGGMGVVYKARQKSLNRLVALKMILDGRLSSSEHVQRFYTEAEAAAKLNHPGITPVYQVGHCDEGHFYSMGFVEGQNLEDFVRSAPLPNREAAEITAEIAQAIHYAHEQGVIHRDLKPQNILLDEQRRTKITDFGLAKVMEADVELTADGQIMGTPAYMPPEQAEGRIREIDHRADVYALGGVLYRLLAGRPPFQAANALETVRQVIEQEPVSPRDLNPAVDRDLETICLKCLQKDPAKRYQTAAELEEDLRRYLRNEPILARPIKRWERLLRWQRRNPIIANLLGALAMTLVLGIAATSYFAVESRQRAKEASEETIRANANAFQVQNKAQEVQKKADEIQARAKENQQLILSQLDLQAQNAMDQGDYPTAMLWRAKALEVAEGETDRQELYQTQLTNLLRNCPRLLQVWFTDQPLKIARFDESGQKILIADKASFRVVGRNGEEGKPFGPEYISPEVFSANGDLVLVHQLVRKQVLETKQGKILATLPPGMVGLGTLSPDGSQVALFSSEKNALHFFDPRTGMPLGPSIELAGNLRSIEFSPDGKSVLVHKEAGISKSEFQWFDLQSEQKTPLTIHTSGHVPIWAFRPDSRQLVYKAVQASQMVVVDLPSGNKRLLPQASSGQVHSLAYSVGGRYLAAGHDRVARVWDLRTMRLTSVSFPHEAPIGHLAFSPDRRFLATASNDGSVRIWDLLKNRLHLPPLWHGAAVKRVEFSPEGDQLLTMCDDKTVRLWGLPTGTPRTFQQGETLAVTEIMPWNRGTFFLHGLGSPETGRGLRIWKSQERQAGPPIPWPDHDRTLHPRGTELLGLHRKQVEDSSEVVVLDLATLRVKSLLKTPGEFSLKNAFHTPAGKRRVVWNTELENKLIDPVSQEVIQTLPKSILRSWPSPSGKYLAVFGYSQLNHELQLLNVVTGEWVGKPQSTGKGYSAMVEKLVFSSDETWFATVNRKQEVGIWDTATNQLITPMISHNRKVLDILPSPDGKLLATSLSNTAVGWGNEPGQITVWDAKTGEPVSPVIKTQGPPRRLAFSPDSRWLAVADTQGTAQVWEAKSGHPITPTLRIAGAVHDVEFSQDGKELITASGTIRFYQLAPEHRSAAEWEEIAQILSGRRLDKKGAVRSVQLEQELWNDLRSKHGEIFSRSEEAQQAWHLQQAEDRAAEKWDQSAIEHLNQPLKQAPESWLLWHRRGRANLFGKDAKAAIQDFKKAIAFGANVGEVWFRLAEAHQMLNDWESAIAALTHLIDHYPVEWRAYELRGNSHAQQKQWKPASQDFQQYLKVSNDYDAKISYALALTQWASKDQDAFRETASRMLESCKKNITEHQSHVLRSWSLMESPPQAEWDVALQHATQLTKQSQDVDHQITHASVLVRTGQPKEGLKMLSALLPKASEKPQRLWVWLAIAAHHAGEKDQAKDCLKKCNPGPTPTPEIENWQARLELQILTLEAKQLLLENDDQNSQ